MKFRKAWRWSKSLEEFIGSKCEGFVVHICSGESLLGDIRIDKHTDVANIRGDMLNIPLKPGIADTVLCDPVYAIDRRVRCDLCYELRRILKLGGRLIVKGQWLPTMPYMEYEDIYVADCGWPAMGSYLVSVSRKIKTELAVGPLIEEG